MKKLFVIIFLLLPVCSICQLNHFLIGIWSYDYDNNTWPIPEGTERAIGNDIEFLRQLKEQNFNCVNIESQLFSPSMQYASSTPSKSFLDNASSLNVSVILKCPDIFVEKQNPSYNSVNCNEGLTYYGNHPSILGFTIIDEPEPPHFNAISQYMQDIQAYNGTLLRYVNLLPMYADVTRLGDSTGTSAHSVAYENYVDNFIQSTNPNILSFDSYPIWFGWPNDFFYNLDIVSRKSVQYNIPFIYVLTPIKSPQPPNPIYCNSTTVAKSIEEFDYVINASLVYGAKGISYWNAGNCYRCWDESVPTNVMQHLKNYHQKLINSENILLSLIYQGAYHVGNSSTTRIGYYESLPPTSNWLNFSNDVYASDIFDTNIPIQAQSGSKIDNMVISFHTDNEGGKYFWIFNKSLTDDETIQINFKENMALLDVLENIICPPDIYKLIHLDPGEAKLFKVGMSYNSYVSLCNQTFYFGICQDTWAENISIGGTSCSVKYYNGSKKNYYANSISLNNGVKIYEGSKLSFNSAHSCSVNSKSTNNLESNTNDYDCIAIFPNPTSKQLCISSNCDNELINNIEIYSCLGVKELEYEDINDVEFIVNLNLSSGTYFIKINTSNRMITKKIIIIK